MIVSETSANACGSAPPLACQSSLSCFPGASRGLWSDLLKRPPQHKLHDCQHADAERQQVREALDLVVELDKQRRDMDPAIEAVEVRSTRYSWR